MPNKCILITYFHHILEKKLTSFYHAVIDVRATHVKRATEAYFWQTIIYLRSQTGGMLQLQISTNKRGMRPKEEYKCILWRLQKL